MDIKSLDILEPTPQESNWCYNPYMDIPTHPHTMHTQLSVNITTTH